MTNSDDWWEYDTEYGIRSLIEDRDKFHQKANKCKEFIKDIKGMLAVADDRGIIIAKINIFLKDNN